MLHRQLPVQAFTCSSTAGELLAVPSSNALSAQLIVPLSAYRKPYLRTLLGLSDINDPRNGLLLFEPLQHAFDDSQVCFLYVEDAGEPKFKLELLDMSLKGVKVRAGVHTSLACTPVVYAVTKRIPG